MNEQENGKEDKNKVEKRFQSSMRKLVAVVGGQSKLRLPKTIPNDKISEVVRELFQEEEEALLKTVKTELCETLKNYAEMERAFRQKEEEISKFNDYKETEFTEKAESLFKKVQGIGELEKSYYQGLSEALNTTQEESQTEKE